MAEVIINELQQAIETIRSKVGHLLMPVRYFKNLNIVPESIFDDEIVNTHFDEKWLSKNYCETYNHDIKSELNIHANYEKSYRA